MPGFPEPRDGRLVVRSAGQAGSPDLGREWVTTAGVCDTPPMLQIAAEQPGTGGVLVRLVLGVEKSTTFLVIRGSATAPGANVGVQMYTKLGSFAYQAQEGSVDISSLGSSVTGRFAVTLTEIASKAQVRFVGSFRDIPVTKLDPTLCAPLPPPTPPRLPTAPAGSSPSAQRRE